MGLSVPLSALKKAPPFFRVFGDRAPEAIREVLIDVFAKSIFWFFKLQASLFGRLSVQFGFVAKSL